MLPRNRNRLGFILIVLLFAAPVITAWVLHESGWEPSATRNYGELIEPPQDLNGARFMLADDKALAWKDANWSWTIFALPGPGCATHCLARLDELRRVRLTTNQAMRRVRIVVLDQALAPATLAVLAPIALAHDVDEKLAHLHPLARDEVAVAFADPHGFLVLRYDAGYDANKLRKDLARLVK